jgi:hypothetical protein
MTRWTQPRCAAAMLLFSAAVPPALAGPTMPNEFEGAGTQLANISSLGGVASYSSVLDAATIHSGGSLLVSANLVSGSFLNVSSFTLGTLGISAPSLQVPAGADTFSLTVDWPHAQTLSFYITIREDDNGDGVISAGDDDYWESADLFLQPGTSVYNIPVSTLELTNPGGGNGVRNFTTTGRMAYLLTFESRPGYPGGRIVTPIAFRVDHAGLYAGAQSIPDTGCAADWNGDGAVNSNDISAYLTAWLSSVQGGTLGADFNGDMAVNSNDISAFLTAWLDAVQDGC